MGFLNAFPRNRHLASILRLIARCRLICAKQRCVVLLVSRKSLVYGINVTLCETIGCDATFSYARSKAAVVGFDRQAFVSTGLKLELWPVSRKKAAPHRSLVIIVNVVEVRRIRKAAVFVTRAAWTGWSRRMHRVDAASGERINHYKNNSAAFCIQNCEAT